MSVRARRGCSVGHDIKRSPLRRKEFEIKLSDVIKPAVLSYARRHNAIKGRVSEASELDIEDIIALSGSSPSTSALKSRAIKYALNKNRALVFVNRDEHGTLASYFILEFYPLQSRCYLASFFTEPSFRGKGLGKWVLDVCEYSAKKANFKWLSSHIEISNERSLKLHRARNFLILRTLEKYYDDGSSGYYLRKFMHDLDG
ncbi:MAG: GNAT family N-acetyltransferase [Alphaproteobacteria bacterium]|nr:GNAT family N-acetyltransferase [Alphaproteobacteria bacterium]